MPWVPIYMMLPCIFMLCIFKIHNLQILTCGWNGVQCKKIRKEVMSGEERCTLWTLWAHLFNAYNWEKKTPLLNIQICTNAWVCPLAYAKAWTQERFLSIQNHFETYRIHYSLMLMHNCQSSWNWTCSQRHGCYIFIEIMDHLNTEYSVNISIIFMLKMIVVFLN